MKEILLSAGVAVASLTLFTYMKRSLNADAPRQQHYTEPTQFQGMPEDPAMAIRWATKRINSLEAWKKQRGNTKVVVAVIDTGCDINHPALKDSLWRNPGETGLDENGSDKAFNGLDDDDNGFVDDIHGWNFVESSPALMDEHGHGTHIAGIVAARDGIGVAPGVSLMVLKYFGRESTGMANLYNTVHAIRYAVRMGAHVINYSGGGIMRSLAEEEALQWAASRGVLIVAAAGNDGTNTDFFHFYPANYDLTNLISVAATDRSDNLIHMSNYGLQTVDIAAPGRNIYSTLPGGRYGYMSGTSQATAFVTGVAALLISEANAERRPEAVITQIMAGGSYRADLRDKLRSGRILNAEGALAQAEAFKLALALPTTTGGRAPAQKTN